MTTRPYPKKGQYYQHYKKGNVYIVEAVWMNTDTDTGYVKYKPLYPCPFDYFERSLEDFMAIVGADDQTEPGEPRFALLDEVPINGGPEFALVL